MPIDYTKRVVCALDTETQEVDLLKAEAVELAIVPLLNNYDPDPKRSPLELLINPGLQALDEGSEALAFNKIGRDHLLKDGLPKEEVRGYLKGWMVSNNIDVIVPLAHNWVFDRIVMCRLIGTKATEELIFRRAKDSHSLAVSINDRYVFHGQKAPFTQTRLSFLAEFFGIDPEGAHRAKFDCLMTAKIYQELMKFPMPSGEENDETV